MYRPAGPRQSKIIRYERQSRELKDFRDRTTVTKATEDLELEQAYSKLKRDVKRSTIATRLFNKKNSMSVMSRQLNKQDEVSKASGFKELKKIYKREQQTLGEVLNKTSASTTKNMKPKVDEDARMKEGLLGEYKYYEKMEKPELIEKLIALEYLTQKLFKKNKYLEELLGVTAQTPSPDMNKTFF